MKILAIGSHPDDLEFGCGGALLKLKKQGGRICLLVMTDGAQGGNPDARRREQEASAKILGAKLLWGRFSDTQMDMNRKLIGTIEWAIKSCAPDLIFTHYTDDTHQDHRNTGQATITATRYIRNVLFYEVPTTAHFTPGVFADIGDVLPQKMKLLGAHRSQIRQTRVRGLSIFESAKSCAIFRGYQDRVKYAEGFMPYRLALFSGTSLKIR